MSAATTLSHKDKHTLREFSATRFPMELLLKYDGWSLSPWDKKSGREFEWKRHGSEPDKTGTLRQDNAWYTGQVTETGTFMVSLASPWGWMDRRSEIAELAEMVRRRVHTHSPSGVFEPDILTGSVGADAVAYGGAILPFYATVVPDKAVLLKGGIPARVAV